MATVSATVFMPYNLREDCRELLEIVISHYCGAHTAYGSYVTEKGQRYGAYMSKKGKNARYGPLGLFMHNDFLNKIYGTPDNIKSITKLMKKYDVNVMFSGERVKKIANQKFGPEFFSRLQYLHDNEEHWQKNGEDEHFLTTKGRAYIKQIVPLSNNDIVLLRTSLVAAEHERQQEQASGSSVGKGNQTLLPGV
jgi:hypothetical protein